MGNTNAQWKNHPRGVAVSKVVMSRPLSWTQAASHLGNHPDLNAEVSHHVLVFPLDRMRLFGPCRIVRDCRIRK